MSPNVAKLSLDQFLRASCMSLTGSGLLLSEHSNPIDYNGNKLDTFIHDLERHDGYYEINNTIYDSVIFTGSDNIYFSYEFNPNTCKALSETLFILSSLQISKTSDNTYDLVESTGHVNTLVLRTISGKKL